MKPPTRRFGDTALSMPIAPPKKWLTLRKTTPSACWTRWPPKPRAQNVVPSACVTVGALNATWSAA